MLWLLLACDPEAAPKDSEAQESGCDSCTDSPVDTGTPDTQDSPADSDPDSTDSGCSLDVPPPDTQDTGAGPQPLRAITGEITWHADFDADAEAAGLVDCDYRRAYTGTERLDQGYLCPDCSLLSPATADMVDGYDDCYRQIDDADRVRTEMIGLGTVDGALHFFRTGVQNVAPGDLGAVTGDASSFSFTYESTSDASTGQVTLTLTGAFTTAPTDQTAPDPSGAATTPRACGWPTDSPGGPTTWNVADGETFPDINLEDQCGERIDLWDFRGRYLVVDVAATNCGPCQAMAARAEEFLDRMEDACIPVETVTLLAESLSTINLPASLQTRQDWAAQFGISSPVLGDEGSAYALVPTYLADDLSYPTTLLLDPEGRLIANFRGYSEEVDDQDRLVGGTWIDIEGAILADF